MKAIDIMNQDPVAIKLDTPVQEIARVLLEHGISALPVLDENDRLAGLVSEADLIRRPEIGTNRRSSWWLQLMRASDETATFDDYLRTHGRTAADVMSDRVISVSEETPVGEIAELLERNRIKRVPVLRDGKLVGIVSRTNLVQALAASKAYAPEVHSDDRSLRSRVVAALKQARVETRWLNVIVINGRVEIWGAVRSQRERQALQVAAESVASPAHVDYHVGLIEGRLSGTNWAV